MAAWEMDASILSEVMHTWQSQTTKYDPARVVTASPSFKGLGLHSHVFTEKVTQLKMQLERQSPGFGKLLL